MKSLKILAAAGLCGLLLAAPGLRAHEDERGHGMMEEDGSAKMNKGLGLTDEQASKMKEARKANREAIRAIHEKAVEHADKLKDLLEKKASDSELSAAIGALKQDKKAMQDQEEKHLATVQAILNPTQQAKMALWMMDKKGRAGREMMRKWKKDHKDSKDHEGHGDKDDDGDDD
jgi:Spy/CpxP family protein refolding chaperone